MGVLMMNPTGIVMKPHLQKVHGLDTLQGKKVGYIFNQHSTASAFWKTLEKAVETKFGPVAVCRVYKENTWAPAARTEVDKLVRETDYALVGVGA